MITGITIVRPQLRTCFRQSKMWVDQYLWREVGLAGAGDSQHPYNRFGVVSKTHPPGKSHLIVDLSHSKSQSCAPSTIPQWMKQYGDCSLKAGPH